ALRSSRWVWSPLSGLGLAGTRRRGGAGGIGACWSPGPWRRNPPGPTDTTRGISGAALGSGWLGTALAARSASAGSAESVSRRGSGALALGLAALFASASFGRGAGLGSLALTGEGRALRPSRCALPITALRETPPSSSAIWLAVAPLSHILVSVAIRSSVQLIRIPSVRRAVRAPDAAVSCQRTPRPIVAPHGRPSPRLTGKRRQAARIRRPRCECRAGFSAQGAAADHGFQPDRAVEPLYEGGPAVSQGADADRLGAGRHHAAVPGDLHRGDGSRRPRGARSRLRHLRRARADHDGHDAERLRQLELLAACGQDAGNHH